MSSKKLTKKQKKEQKRREKERKKKEKKMQKLKKQQEKQKKKERKKSLKMNKRKIKTKNNETPKKPPIKRKTKFSKWTKITVNQGKDFENSSFYLILISTHSTSKSTVSKSTGTPKWNQTFLFGFEENEPIKINVFDLASYNLDKPTDTVDIPIVGEEEITKWFKTMKGSEIELTISIVANDTECTKRDMESKLGLTKVKKPLQRVKSSPMPKNKSIGLSNSNNFGKGVSSVSNMETEKKEVKGKELDETEILLKKFEKLEQLEKRQKEKKRQMEEKRQMKEKRQMEEKRKMEEKGLNDFKPKQKINLDPKVYQSPKPNLRKIITSNKPAIASDLCYSLEFVYGYSGVGRNNIFFNNSGNIIYCAAGIGIVYNPKTRTQKFFLHHNLEISTLTIDHSRNLVATAQDFDLKIYIWKSENCEFVCELTPKHKVGINCLAFSSDSKRLISVGNDENHTISLWDIQSQKLLFSINGANQKSLGCKFIPQNNNQFIIAGLKHILFGTITKNNEITFTNGVFQKSDEEYLLSIAILNSDTILTGSRSGQIYVWSSESKAIVKKIRAHTGPCFALNLVENGDIISGGKDGKVLTFDSNTYSLKKQIKSIVSGPLRAVDIHQNLVVTGSQKNQIWITDLSKNESRMELFSHSKDVYGLSSHPQSGQFISLSDDRSVHLWSTVKNQSIGKLAVNGQPRIGHFSPSGQMVAIGLKDGEFIIASSHGLRLRTNKKDTTSVINNLQFSPDSAFLGVLYENGTVGIYQEETQFRRISKFSIQSPISIDWSTDSQCIRIANQTQIKCWNVRDLKEVNENETVWNSNNIDITRKIPNLISSDIGENIIATYSSNRPYIKIMPFPPVKGLKSVYMKGHGSQITNVKLLPDKKIVSSSTDMCVLQWKKNEN
ncbi:wd-40 repeat protein [Anaeramoeba flamelloides]|uniref:Wd-40 repeat protein n=1 Tax=Anaeramoeba flamelloides TaxID=1746091 RepID=A0AAV7ZYU5_9EUKA|nr:wd-40 repeat protein [Anaeramoeba flamelloides]